MAFRIANKYPIDTQDSKAVGVSLPFSANAVFNSTYTTADQIKSNLINYFMTNPGERYMNPSFGAGLKNTLFEQLSLGNIAIIKNIVQKNLQNYFPQINIGQLEVYGIEDQNILKIELTYSIAQFGIQDQLELILQ